MIQMERFDSVESANENVAKLATAETKDDAEEELGFTRICVPITGGNIYLERMSDTSFQIEVIVSDSAEALSDEQMEAVEKIRQPLEGTQFESDAGLRFLRQKDGNVEFGRRLTAH
jgi:hypothetical protein